MQQAIPDVAPRRPETQIDEPVYAPTVAARYLRLPVSSLRWWTLGNGSHLPVLRIADADGHLLSFRNLVEAHVLSAVMCHDRDRVPLAVVRGVLTFLGERFGSRHPLADPRMDEEGKDLFAARFGALAHASRHGQAAIAAILGSYLQRVQRDGQGEPTRLHIFTRGRPEGPAHVMIDPSVLGGQPCITGTTVTTASVAAQFREGASVLELAQAHQCGRDEIEEAVRYETAVV